MGRLQQRNRDRLIEGKCRGSFGAAHSLDRAVERVVDRVGHVPQRINRCDRVAVSVIRCVVMISASAAPDGV